MKKITSKSSDTHTLRQQAEQKLSNRHIDASPPSADADVRAMLHELQVHQIELDMQNDELLRAQATAQEAVDKYTELFDFAPIPYFVLDAGGVIREVNLAGAALLGLERVRVAGQLFSRFVTPELRQAFADFCKTLQQSDDKQTCELRLLHPSQSLCEVHLEGLTAKEGCRLAVIDITERKMMENTIIKARDDLEIRVQSRTAELQEAMTELERSNKELEQFAYVASHDLLEPLRMVSSYVQLLDKRYKNKLDANADDFINFAIDGTVRMKRLITDLITYSRVGTRGKPFAPTDCETILEQGLSNLKLLIKEKGAVVTHDPLPAVMGDDTQLLQLFQNLIDNGIKFKGNKSPNVHISVNENDNYWIFSVKDNGIGIKPADYERIFIVFQRLQLKDSYPGTGIGLAIAKKIVERHGGKIWLESKPGKGTTFYFTIPKERR